MLQSKRFGANRLLRIVAALGLSLALAACSSSDSGIKNERDRALEDAETQKMTAEGLQRQITAAMTALTAAGAVGDDLAAQVADIVSKVSQGTIDLRTAQQAINDAEAALRAAGLTGADLAALVVVAVADVAELAQMKQEEQNAATTANRKNWAKVHDLLSQLNANQVVDGTAVARPEEDVTEGKTQAEPTMTAWAALYNPNSEGEAVITMTASTADRTNGEWSEAVIPGRTVSSDEDGELSAPGTFRGVAGTFTCAATCGAALTFDKDGEVTNASSAGTGWMFEATAGLAAMIPIPDPDYVEYGFWLTKDEDDAPTRFNVFYNGVGELATAVVLPARPVGGDDDPVDITATYEGDANGKYLVRDSDGDATAGPGYFTAKAMLQAVIRPTGATGDANAYTVSGEISEFMDGTATPLGDLVVTLDDGDPETAYDSSTTEFLGKTSGSTDPLGSGKGDWEAEFYGADDAGDAATRGGFPAEAAGAFNYDWGLGAVQGAFGAEYVKEDE